MKIARYDVADLQRLIAEEVGEGDFVAPYLKGVAATLIQAPEQYRGFGPYWWPLKRLLIDAGYVEFGDEIEDEDTADTLTYPSPAMTVAAAYTFSEHAMGAGMQYSSGHTVMQDDGEQGTYWIGDETMEILIVARLVTEGAGNGANQA